MKRNRRMHVAWLALTIVLGLASRTQPAAELLPFIATYAGDTLWALAVFLVLGALFPRTRTGTIALLALGIAFAVEGSQLYQAAWINTVRETRLGALALGAGFKWSDLLCYTVGCLAGAAGERCARLLTPSASVPGS